MMRFALPTLFAACLLLGCPTDDSDGSSSSTDGTTQADNQTNDNGGLNSDSSVSDTGTVPDRPAELAGTYDFVSVTRQGQTITTENQDIGMGAMIRGAGTLTTTAEGRWDLVLEFYVNDSLDETEESGGSWWIEDGDVLVIEDESDSSTDRFNYATDSRQGTFTMTAISGSDIDEMVFQRRD